MAGRKLEGEMHDSAPGRTGTDAPALLLASVPVDGAPRSRATRVLTVVRHPVGGIRTYLKYTYGALTPGKYRFTLLTVEEPQAAYLPTELNDLTCEFVRPSGDKVAPALLRAVAGALATGKYDLIHSHGFTAGTIAAIGNLPFGVPHVLTSHDVFRPEQFTRRYHRIGARLLERVLQRVDVVQSVSHDAQENLVAYLPRVNRARLTVIPNGIDVDRFSRTSAADPAAGATEWDLPSVGFVFGFLGRLMPQKGFDYLIEAVSMLAADPEVDGRFTVVVVNDGAWIREQKASIAARELSGHFRFVGLVPDVSAILSRLDAVVMPSLWEAGPLLAMESLVSGCPLIASSCVGLREVIDKTPALSVTPTDSKGLADAMKRLMRDYASVKRATVEFMPAAKHRYDVRRTSDALDSLFSRTLSARQNSVSLVNRASAAVLGRLAGG
jgi:glycosyltransferase involved in cell wall biosynthesis